MDVAENIYVGMWFLEYPINNLAGWKWGEDCQRWLISFSLNENKHQKKKKMIINSKSKTTKTT